MCRYVQGDFRFRTGYSKGNPRKMVKLWAEKEFRNLSRLHAAGIRCPQPVHLRLHVLVMEFVGLNGVAAPRLKVSSHSAWWSRMLLASPTAYSKRTTRPDRTALLHVLQ